MRVSKNQQLNGPANRPIAYDLFIPESKDSGLVVFCHGFKGFKDWGPWPLMAEYIVNQGYAFVKFNFSHNGVSPNKPMEFGDSDGFKLNTTSKELADLQALLNHLCANHTDSFNAEDITLIGHSRGGPIAILQAIHDTRISKVVTWNAVADLHAWISKYDRDQWQQDGHVIIRNARTGQELPMGYDYLLDLEQNNYDVLEAASKLKVPYSIIHAENDEAVPLSAANALHAACALSELSVIPDTGHTFGGKHPWDENELPEALQTAIGASII